MKIGKTRNGDEEKKEKIGAKRREEREREREREREKR